jgi:heparanase
MGTTVLDAGSSPANLHLYAQCAREHPDDVTMLAINTSLTESAHLDVTAAARRYTLSARKLDGAGVQLNGQTLALGPNDALPVFDGVYAPPGRSELAPATITFLVVEGAGNAACK